MRYMLLIYSKELPGGGRDLSQRNYDGHRALMDEAAGKGVLLAAEPLAPVSSATTALRYGPPILARVLLEF